MLLETGKWYTGYFNTW